MSVKYWQVDELHYRVLWEVFCQVISQRVCLGRIPCNVQIRWIASPAHYATAKLEGLFEVLGRQASPSRFFLLPKL